MCLQRLCRHPAAGTPVNNQLPGCAIERQAASGSGCGHCPGLQPPRSRLPAGPLAPSSQTCRGERLVREELLAGRALLWEVDSPSAPPTRGGSHTELPHPPIAGAKKHQQGFRIKSRNEGRTQDPLCLGTEAPQTPSLIPPSGVRGASHASLSGVAPLAESLSSPDPGTSQPSAILLAHAKVTARGGTGRSPRAPSTLL